MKALLLIPAASLCAAAGFALASCGANEATPAGPVPSLPDTVTGPAEETVAPPTTTDEDEDVATPSFVTYQVWFSQGESLFVTHRSEKATPRVGSAAVESLLEGPEEDEQDLNIGTQIPTGTQLLGLKIQDGIAHVDLTSEFESGGGTLSMSMRLAQVVFTLTQFPTVKGVLFSLDGEPIEVLGGEGLIIDHPLKRKDYADLLPPILVTSPAIGRQVGNPVVVRGSANVFEANVTVRILDQDGNEIASTFTTATCGTGCRGTFKVAVPYEVAEEQDGTIVVHDDDAAGVGRPPHEVRIPVRLTPTD